MIMNVVEINGGCGIHDDAWCGIHDDAWCEIHDDAWCEIHDVETYYDSCDLLYYSGSIRYIDRPIGQ